MQLCNFIVTVILFNYHVTRQRVHPGLGVLALVLVALGPLHWQDWTYSESKRMRTGMTAGFKIFPGTAPIGSSP